MAQLRKVGTIPPLYSLSHWPALNKNSPNIINLLPLLNRAKLSPSAQTQSDFIKLILKQYGQSPKRLHFRNSLYPNAHAMRQALILDKIFACLELKDIFNFASAHPANLWLVMSECILCDILKRIIQYKIGNLEEFKHYFKGQTLLEKATDFRKITGYTVFELMLQKNQKIVQERFSQLFNEDYFQTKKMLLKHKKPTKIKIFQSNLIDYGNLFLLPKEIARFTNLEIIRIQESKIIALPSSIGSLSKLKKLELNQTSIRHISFQIQNLKELTSLAIIKTPLILIPHEISKLTKLVKFTCKDTEITDIPDAILKLQSIKTIYFKTTKMALARLKVLREDLLQKLPQKKRSHVRLIFSDLIQKANKTPSFKLDKSMPE